jgi:hypothetical protein
MSDRLREQTRSHIFESKWTVYDRDPLWEILWLRETLNSLLIGIRSVL